MRATKKIVLMTSTAIAASIVASAASAGGFALREQSAYYQGTSFAGNGTSSSSISSMFWNPATITSMDGKIVFEAHNAFIIPKSDITGSNTVPNSLTTPTGLITTSYDTGDIGHDAWIPASYTSYNFNDKIYLGVGINGPFGLSTKPDDSNWTGAGYNRSSKIFSINLNPVVGYKINEMFSVAIGPQIQYADVRLTNASASPTIPGATLFPGQQLDGDGVGVGLTAGVTIKPTATTEIGIGYRSAIFTDIDGTIAAPNPANPFTTAVTDVKTVLATPDMVTLSAKQSITDNIRVLGTFEWTNWSRLKEPQITADATGATVTTLPFNYNDGYFLALGGEYDFNDKLTFRAGAAYEWSPIDDQIRSARLPDNDRIWVSAGASYVFNEHFSFDLGYTHIFGTDTDLNLVPGHQDYSASKGSLTGSVDSSVDILTASVRIKF